MLAFAAAAFVGAVLWFSDAGSSRSAAFGPSIGPRTDPETHAELLRLDDARLVAPRSSVVAAPMQGSTSNDADTTPSHASLVSTGSVRGRVIDDGDVGVASVKVSLYRGQVKQGSETDPAGRFSFEGLERGSYRLYVDGRSLPDGLLPPWRQQVPREVAGRPTGIFGTAFRLTDGAEREVDLRVFAAGSVRGRLVGPQGQPIEDTPVTIRSSSGVTHSVRTDADGRFAIANVYPGEYSTIVKLRAEREGFAASTPLPIRFDLAAGESRVLAELVAGVGGHILRGSVVDQTGGPVAGLAVVCEAATHAEAASRWESVTDVAGRFEIGRVPSTELVVTVGPDECSKAAGIARISKRVVPMEVDARAAPDVLELGRVEVEASHPFRVLGHVRVDPAWVEANGLQRWTIRIDATTLGEARSRIGDVVHADARSDLRGKDSFKWGCAMPHPPIELTVVLRGAQGALHERSYIVQPASDATQELLVAFP